MAAVHHINGAWRSDSWSEDEGAIEWLSDLVDGKQDAIPVFASQALGPVRATELAKAAEDADDWWMASLRWSASALSEHHVGAHSRSLPLLQASAKALERVDVAHKAKNKLEMSVLFLALQSYSPTIDQAGYTARCARILHANAEDFDVEEVLAQILFTDLWPTMQCGDMAGFQRSWGRLLPAALDARDSVHASDHVQRCLLSTFRCFAGVVFSYGLFDDPTEWSLFGEQGSTFEDVLHYDYDRMHVKMRPMTSFDLVVCYPGWAAAPLSHWGDVFAANAAFDHMLPYALRCLEEWSPQSVFEIWYLKSVWPLWLYFLGRKEDARAILYAGPYEDLPPQFDWIAEVTGPVWRPRGSAVDHTGVFAAEDFLAHAQFLDVVLADEAPPAAEALARLPEPEKAARLGVLSPFGSIANLHFSTVGAAMLAHERLGSTEGALTCAGIILGAELTMGGTTSRQRHSLAHASRGRILAAQGNCDEAEAAFEAAIERADSYGGHFFAALALRDLCEHVLDGTSRAEAGRQRLAVAVSSLACSVEDIEGIVYP